MASRDKTLAALRAAFALSSSTEEADVVEDVDGGIDVMGEEWTFHAEGWPGPAIAWLALDDEPEGQGEQALRAACEAALSPGPLVAFTTADQRLDGALCAGLLASADPLSQGLAQAFVTTTTKDS